MDERRAARITFLKRYISMLQQDEKRLNWVISSSIVSEIQREEARVDLKGVLEKLMKAEDELMSLKTGQ